MRILIISLPRTGSTSLMYKLAKDNNLSPLFEPFDGTNRVIYNGEDNVVLKTIICHHPNNLELIRSFDKTILLSRININELIESHSYQTYFSKVKGYNSNNPYTYKRPPQNIIDICSSDINKWISDIQKLSDLTMIPITYYEDIFDVNSNDRLRIKNTLVNII
jgi:hypothetical protein